jgi:flagella basal body P-ring formation protein FlgA
MNNNNFKIIQKNRLKVVISDKDFFVGESILFICCEESKVPTQYTIQLEDNYHVIDPIVKYIKHSFDPNVKVNGHYLVATRKIKAGDEIKRNYYDTEEVIVKEFTDIETGERVNTKNLYLYNNKNTDDGLLFDAEF